MNNEVMISQLQIAINNLQYIFDTHIYILIYTFAIFISISIIKILLNKENRKIISTELLSIIKYSLGLNLAIFISTSGNLLIEDIAKLDLAVATGYITVQSGIFISTITSIILINSLKLLVYKKDKEKTKKYLTNISVLFIPYILLGCITLIASICINNNLSIHLLIITFIVLYGLALSTIYLLFKKFKHHIYKPLNKIIKPLKESKDNTIKESKEYGNKE